MKDWIPVVTVGFILAGLMLTQFAAVQTSIGRLDDRLTSQIETLNNQVYELNERVTRVETLILDAADQP